MEVSLDTVRRRDSKHLYDGSTKNVVGVDLPWWAPEQPDIVIDADLEEKPDVLAQHVIETAGLLPQPREAR